MKTVLQNEKYGEIVYEESAWSGKKSISINGVILQKKDKTTFEYVTDEEIETVIVKGNSMSGAKLSIGGQTIQVIAPPKWYEVALSVLIFAFILVWGNVPQLCLIFPLVGGAIGGFISGMFAVLNFMIMRKLEKPYFKILIFIAFMAATILVCYLIALLIISAY